MTKKQRTDHIKNINDYLCSEVSEPDRFGHYKINDYRFKMQKISVRLEKKIGKSWLRIKSWYYKDLTTHIIEDHILRVKM